MILFPHHRFPHQTPHTHRTLLLYTRPHSPAASPELCRRHQQPLDSSLMVLSRNPPPPWKVVCGKTQRDTLSRYLMRGENGRDFACSQRLQHPCEPQLSKLKSSSSSRNKDAWKGLLGLSPTIPLAQRQNDSHHN
jgi:hypothetical protein